MEAAPQIGQEPGRHGQCRDDATRRQSVPCLDRVHAHEVHVLADLVDRILDPEALSTDVCNARQVVLVHEGDAGLRAAVPRYEADQPRHEQRIGDQHAQQQRRAEQDA